MALDDFKRALRRDAKKCRDSTTDDPSAFGAAIARSAEAIIDLAARAAPVVSGYMAIGSELDPAELMDHLRQLGAH